MILKRTHDGVFHIFVDGIEVHAFTSASPLFQVLEGSTGAGSAALGANCPAVTATAPYTWIKAKSADGSTVWIPAWK